MAETPWLQSGLLECDGWIALNWGKDDIEIHVKDIIRHDAFKTFDFSTVT